MAATIDAIQVSSFFSILNLSGGTLGFKESLGRAASAFNLHARLYVGALRYLE